MKKTIIISLVSFMTFFLRGIKINATSIHKHVFTPSTLEESYYNENMPTDTTNNQTEHLSTSEKGWFYQPRNDGIPPEEPQAILDLLNKYSAYYVGDTSKKVLYLTFDEGYENGYTPQILDVLKRHNIKAAFFVVKPYITGNKEIIKRMVEEGHLVCNHSTNHPSMASIYDKNKFIKEFTGVEDAYREVTGKEMSKLFRPPMGKYSELSLHYTADCGYKTIFWSFAYDDWNIRKQPSHEYAKKKILQRTHNGAIILLHAVSKTNAEILEEVITEWKSQGYEFKNLDELSLRVN
jgi:peptidoglycan-N-acetylmuramic acid deacetylase